MSICILSDKKGVDDNERASKLLQRALTIFQTATNLEFDATKKPNLALESSTGVEPLDVDHPSESNITDSKLEIEESKSEVTQGTGAQPNETTLLLLGRIMLLAGQPDYVISLYSWAQ